MFYLSQSEFVFLSVAIKRALHSCLDKGCGGDIQKCLEGVARVSPIIERPGKLWVDFGGWLRSGWTCRHYWESIKRLKDIRVKLHFSFQAMDSSFTRLLGLL